MRKEKNRNLSRLDRFRYKKNVYKMFFSNLGPQKQFVFSLRFPVSYKNNQLLSYRVDFPILFDWMGQIREYSLDPIMKSILKLTKNGDWGLATNSVKLKIFDFFTEVDIVEGRLWLDRISGHDNIYHLTYDWLRYLGRNKYERVATSSIVITCVKILGHGSAVIVKPPRFFDKFLKKMLPPADIKRKAIKYPSKIKKINLGENIKSYESLPKLLFKNSYQTTLDNSNLIGNLYFANYARWINSTKDLFLFKVFPNLFYRSKSDSEFCTIDFFISHKQEAMPFDQILVEMYILNIFQNGIILKYEIFKMNPNEELVLLASAKQTIGYFSRDNKKIRLKNIPETLLSILIN